MSERNPERAEPADESGGRVAAQGDGPTLGTAAPDSAESDENQSLLKQLTVGTVIDGKYKIDEIIGRGAMGVVVAATHIHLKERVALKFLNARAQGTGEDFHTRFRREAQVSAKLRNEHITRVIDVGVWREKLPFMVMDHLSGVDMRRTLKQGGPLPVNVALDYIVQLCEGLAEAHAHGIVHRDLKPSNLFVIKRPDGTDLLKILDFGISKWSSHEQEVEELTQTGVVLGSPKYMSPEQLFGSSTVDPRADIWSIAAIFYEMLTGQPPYNFPTLTRICAELAADKPPVALRNFVPDIPPPLELVVMSCFIRDREQRPRDVAELAGALLESVDAPFAGQVKQKIASMLDPKGAGASLASSSGGLAMSGANYRALSISGTSGPVRSSSGAIRVASTRTPSMAAAGIDAPAEGREEGRSKVITVAAVIGLLVVVGVGAFLFGGRGNTAQSTQTAPTQSAPVAAAVAPPPIDTTPAPTAMATAAPTGTATAAAPTDNPGASATLPATQTGHAPGTGGHGSPRPHPRPQPPQPTSAPVATATAAAPAPTPTVIAAPPPTKPSNPLEDRQ